MYKNKSIKDIGSLYISLCYTYTLLDVNKSAIGVPYDLLKDIYLEESEELFDEDKFALEREEEEATSEMLYMLVDHLENAFDFKAFSAKDRKGANMILALLNYIREIAHEKLEDEKLASSAAQPVELELDEASKIVEDFLNGSWVKSLVVQKPGITKQGSRVVSETFGIYDLRKKVAKAQLQDRKSFVYSDRTSVVTYWFAEELGNYHTYLKGVSGLAAEEDEFEFLSELLSGVRSSAKSSSEQDWGEGDAVEVTFTGLNLPGVALRVDTLKFTKAEIEYMAIQIQTLNELAGDIKDLCNTPEELYFGENICVKTKQLSKVEKLNKKLQTYDLSLLNMDRSAESFVKQIKTITTKPEDERPEVITGLFYGIPGSGKSLLCSHLGAQLNMPIMKRTYADLQSMYVGEGEKSLSEAFKEAEAEGAILLIDEIDSIAGNRSKADKNYQKTFTNQLLTELDDFKGIFIATSNSMESLDPAVLRRLFLKVKFDFLTEEQVETAFKLYFPKLKRSKLGFIPYLTPGDFKAVKEASQFDEGKISVKRVRELLKHEVELKKVTLNEVIGLEKTVGYHL